LPSRPPYRFCFTKEESPDTKEHYSG